MKPNDYIQQDGCYNCIHRRIVYRTVGDYDLRIEHYDVCFYGVKDTESEYNKPINTNIVLPYGKCSKWTNFFKKEI